MQDRVAAEEQAAEQRAVAASWAVQRRRGPAILKTLPHLGAEFIRQFGYRLSPSDRHSSLGSAAAHPRV